jgi:hypothetical protein
MCEPPGSKVGGPCGAVTSFVGGGVGFSPVPGFSPELGVIESSPVSGGVESSPETETVVAVGTVASSCGNDPQELLPRGSRAGGGLSASPEGGVTTTVAPEEGPVLLLKADAQLG